MCGKCREDIHYKIQQWLVLRFHSMPNFPAAASIDHMTGIRYQERPVSKDILCLHGACTLRDEKMAVKKGGNCFIVWLLMLTATAQGYKSCSELQAKNQTEPFKIDLKGQTFSVSCNMSVTPARTIINVVNSKNVAIDTEKDVFQHSVLYSIADKLAIKELVELSENCQQFVSYHCKNAPLFGDLKNLSGSSWASTTVGGEQKFYWSNCDIKETPCKCDGKEKETVDEGYLTTKEDLPVSKLRFGGYKADSNVSFTIGDLVCYGDEQKNAFSFENLNSFVAMNLSSNVNEIEFKFRPSSLRNENKIIATIEMKDNKQIKVKYADEMNLEISEPFTKSTRKFKAVKEEWHSVKLETHKKSLYATIDGGRKHTLVEKGVNSVAAKLSFGDPSHKCKTFTGCIKDLKINGKDATTDLQKSKMKAFVRKGCHKVNNGTCNPTNLFDDDDDDDDEEEEGSGEGSGKGGGVGVGDGDDGDGDGGDNNTAVIVIMVIFLLLLILLLVAFFVTWYLKRNKGVYQTHEGSAENIHGDTDNLTLVSRPSEQEAESEKSKEYYL